MYVLYQEMLHYDYISISSTSSYTYIHLNPNNRRYSMRAYTSTPLNQHHICLRAWLPAEDGQLHAALALHLAAGHQQRLRDGSEELRLQDGGLLIYDAVQAITSSTCNET